MKNIEEKIATSINNYIENQIQKHVTSAEKKPLILENLATLQALQFMLEVDYQVIDNWDAYPKVISTIKDNHKINIANELYRTIKDSDHGYDLLHDDAIEQLEMILEDTENRL